VDKGKTMNELADPSPTDDPNLVDDINLVNESESSRGWKIQLAVLCTMLVLALVGMGVTQASETGAWEFWLFIVAVYTALSVWRSASAAKQAGQSITKSIVRELAHWATLLGFLAVLVMLERREIVDRESASVFALMLLAMSCCMAGVHIDWLLLIVGVVLTIMLVAMASLEQYSVVLWLVMVVVAGLAAAFFYFKSKRGGSEAN
jgi:hypothetical protein